MRRFIFALNCACVFSFTNQAAAATLQEALATAMANNPTILAAEQTVNVARENLNQAKADFWPTLDGSAGISSISTDIDGGADSNYEPKNAAVSMEYSIYKGGETSANKRKQKANFSAAEMDFKDTYQQVLLNVVKAYTNVMYAQEVLNLRNWMVVLLQQQLKQAQARFDAGEITKTDVKQAEARLAAAQAEQTAAIGNVRVMRSNLMNLLGEDISDLNWPEQPANLPDNMEDAKAMARAHSPQVKSAEESLIAAKHAVRAAKGGYLPELSAAASMGRNWETATGTDNYTRQAGLTLSIPFFKGGKTVSEVKEALAVQKQYEQRFEQKVRDVETAAIQAWNNWEVARAAGNSFQTSVEANKIALEGVEKEEEFGERTVLDVLNARQELLEAQVNLASAKRDYVNSAYELLQVIGALEADEVAGELAQDSASASVAAN